MTIDFSCDGCRYPFKVPASLAGKQGKCPKCGAVTSIPYESVPASRVTRDAPRARSGPPPFPGEDDRDDRPRDDFDDEPRPMKKKKKSRKGLIIGLSVGGGVLLIGLVVTLVLLLGGSGLSGDDLKFLPDNCIAIASIKPADLVDSALVKDNRAAMNLGDFEDKMKKTTGFVPKDIERVVLGTDGSDALIIVKMSKSIKAEDIKKAFKDSGPGIEFKEESKVGSYTMYKTGDDGPAFCVVSSSLVVGSNKAKALESVLKRDKKAQFSSSFQKIVDKADFSKTVAFAVDLKAVVKKTEDSGFNLNQLPGVPGVPIHPAMLLGGFKQMTEEVEGVAGSVKISSEISASGSLFCKDSKTAESYKKKADEGLKKAREDAREENRKNPDRVPKEALDLMNSISVSQSGNVVSGSITVKRSVIEAIKKKGM